MTQATDSQFAMWRGAIVLAWADGRLDAGEKARLAEYFKDNIYLSDAQRATLIKDLEQGGVQMKEVWPAITDREDRAHLLDIATDIFWADGDYSPTEHELYDKMFADQMATVDMQKVKKDMADIVAQIPREHEEYEREYVEELSKAGPAIGAVGKLMYHFERTIGVDPVDNV